MCGSRRPPRRRWPVARLGRRRTRVRGRDPDALRELALSTRRSRRSDGLLTTTPAQLSQGAAVVALAATVIAMPQARNLGSSPEVALGVCLVAVAASLLVLHTGFLIVYLGLYAERGGLELPGDDEPGLVAFVYFAASVGTTFGTTDVTVTQSRSGSRCSCTRCCRSSSTP